MGGLFLVFCGAFRLLITGLLILHSHQQCIDFSFPPHPLQYVTVINHSNPKWTEKGPQCGLDVIIPDGWDNFPHIHCMSTANEQVKKMWYVYTIRILFKHIQWNPNIFNNKGKNIKFKKLSTGIKVPQVLSCQQKNKAFVNLQYWLLKTGKERWRGVKVKLNTGH